jgi:polysaccharide pyruvyl transferase WcaK-like protein
MKTINAVHLASFNGNIGDNANHNGFYNSLKATCEFELSFTELEIREFYWKQRFFDESFVDYVNQFDLLVIGGGNYFELWVEHSPTGTSVMIEPELFKKIKVPVIFNALGVDPRKGASKECCDKFRYFLDIIFNDKKNIVSMRNDGSMKNLIKYIGQEYAEKFLWTPDAGINLQNLDSQLHPTSSYLAVNIAGDMLDLRFPEGSDNSYSQFINEVAAAITTAIENNIVSEAVLIPHIFRDIQSISELLEALPDHIRRKHITVAPLLNGTGCEKKIFGLYQNAKITLAMRFHANLCSISFGTPTIGLISYRQIFDLYEELELGDFAVDTTQQHTKENILQLMEKIDNNIDIRQLFENTALKNKTSHLKYIQQIAIFLEEQFR